MGDTHYGNAMTEVALALAMAFFSIMILAMVSMGAGHAPKAAEKAAAATLAAKLAPNAPAEKSGGAMSPAAEDTLLIYRSGRYFDRDLQPVSPEDMTFPGRVILALSPETEMAEALQARARIPTDNLVVSLLNDKWLAALRRGPNTEN